MYLKVFAFCLVAIVSITATPSSRILGGSDAPDGVYPYQISLQNGYFFNVKHICGGTILNNKWVLTAGRCITENEGFGKSFYVVAGVNFLNDKDGQKINVKKTIVHPDYKGGPNPNDIALIELEEKLQFNAKVAAAKLPAVDSIPKGGGILSGWGSISATGDPIKILQHLTVSFISIGECRRALAALGIKDTLEQTNLCTAPLLGGTSTCKGDPGSPVAIKSADSFEIIGIVSWILSPCGRVGAPSIHTRVSAYIGFINEHINN